MDTVVARFHHVGRDLDELEDALSERGARDARITGYTVVLTFDSGSYDEAAESARKALDRIGATKIKITKRGRKFAAA